MVDAIELLNAAKRLLLAATVGGKPKNVKTGTMIIPPPKTNHRTQYTSIQIPKELTIIDQSL